MQRNAECRFLRLFTNPGQFSVRLPLWSKLSEIDRDGRESGLATGELICSESEHFGGKKRASYSVICRNGWRPNSWLVSSFFAANHTRQDQQHRQ